MKKKISITYFINEFGDEFEYNCATQATKMKFGIDDALDKIRARLKYCDDVGEIEQENLENIRSILAECVSGIEGV